MPRTDYHKAASLLEERFLAAEEAFLSGHEPSVAPELAAHLDTVFQSSTQSYREVLLGCIVARITEPGVDVRLPYVSQGPSAFHGRDLDEKVINPFLKAKQIPCSKGPYLNVFRRQVRFDESTRSGLRDQLGYDALLAGIHAIENARKTDELLALLEAVLYRFVKLREQATVALARVHRLSLSQYDLLVDYLLNTPSGGLMPMLIVESMLRSIRDAFGLEWEIVRQGINVSDRAAQAGGDITVSRGGAFLMAIEVTERAVDKARVVDAFRTKIAPAGITDYLFLVHLRQIDDAARQQAQQYFAQGHDVNFIDIREWVHNALATVGAVGRTRFNENLQSLLDEASVPKQLKVAWNDAIGRLTSI